MAVVHCTGVRACPWTSATDYRLFAAQGPRLCRALYLGAEAIVCTSHGDNAETGNCLANARHRPRLYGLQTAPAFVQAKPRAVDERALDPCPCHAGSSFTAAARSGSFIVGPFARSTRISGVRRIHLDGRHVLDPPRHGCSLTHDAHTRCRLEKPRTPPSFAPECHVRQWARRQRPNTPTGRPSARLRLPRLCRAPHRRGHLTRSPSPSTVPPQPRSLPKRIPSRRRRDSRERGPQAPFANYR